MESKHSSSHMFYLKYCKGLPVAKALIEYNSNDLEEMMKKRRSQLILSLLSKKLILKIMKMLLTLDDWMYKKKTIKILSRITSLKAYKSKLMRKKIFKKLLDDCGIVYRKTLCLSPPPQMTKISPNLGGGA